MKLSLIHRVRRRSFHLCCLLTTLCVSTAFAEKTPTINRLATGWEYYQGTLGSIWEIWRGTNATDNVDWSPVSIPHCFNARDAVDPDIAYYQGPGWYRIRIQPTNPFPNGRTLLHFNGAGQKAQVFVGLEKAGEHVGGYDEWDVDITDIAARALTNKISNGTVPIAVLCDNSRDAESIPSDLSDFNRYGGLYRDVNLVYVPALSIERVHIEPTLAPDGKASVKILSRLYNPTALSHDVQLNVEVVDASGKIVHTFTHTEAPWTGMKPLTTFEIATPQLWSPKSPTLYRCVVTLKSAAGEQRIEEPFGLRSFEWVDHGPFKLNGERLLLRGTHYHEDHAGVGAAVPDEVVRRTFQQIKDMGVNFVRLGHYQQSPLVLKLCDELGLLVWEEIPWCRGGLGGARYQQQCRDMMRAMIDQHYNHPAVIIWGLGNENGWPGDFERFDTNAVRAFMKELNQLAHQLDPSRKTATRYCEFCRDVPDIYSPSIWAGWYSGRYPEYLGTLNREIKSVPHFFHAEWGGDSHAGRFSEDPEIFLHQVETGRGAAERTNAYKPNGGSARASRDGDWSESYMANLFDWYLRDQEQLTNFTGAAQWVFKDFATPLRPENPVPRVNQKGVLERDGTPKESYYIFQSYWADKPMIHIFGHGWTTRWGKPGESKMIKVFSNCREAELFVNGVSAGIKRRDIADYPAAGLHWLVQLKEGTNIIRAIGRQDRIEISDEIQVGYTTQQWGSPATLTLATVAQSNDIAVIEARALDQAGELCLDAANLIRFAATGDGQLLDNLGTVNGSRAVQLCNGRARISMRLTGTKAVVSLTSTGLPTSFLTVTEEQPTSSKKLVDAGSPKRE